MRSGLLLLLLMASAFFSVIDRNVMSLLLPVIREDIQLSATEAGLLTGLAFVLVYGVIALPYSRLTDRRGPQVTLPLAMLIWSLGTLCCGLAASFPLLFAARMLVGSGDAGFVPAANTALAKIFPREKLGRALAGLTLGTGSGQVIGFTLAGVIAADLGWRTLFQLLGGLGIAYAVALFFLWRMLFPAMAAPAPHGAAAVATPPLRHAVRGLLVLPGFAALLTGAVAHALSAYGTQQWMPTFLHEQHGMALGEIGLWMGLVFSAVSIVGTSGTGLVIDRFRTRKLANCMRVAAWSVVLTVPFYLAGFLLPGEAGKYALLPASFLSAVYYTPTYLVVQKLAPDSIRASANALVVASFTVVGFGLGPAFAGMVTDALQALGTAQPLAYALCLMAALNLVSGVFFFRAAFVLRDAE